MFIVNKIRRLCKRVREKGLFCTLGHCCHRLVRLVLYLTPSAQRTRRRQQLLDAEFQKRRQEVDALFDNSSGLDTGGRIQLDDLSIKSNGKDDGTPYQAVFPERFREALEAIRIEYSDFTFIDFGSGKGRAVLIAANYPFEKAIGVEFAEELNKAAEMNWRIYRNNSSVRCQSVEWHCIDAAMFPLPDRPLVIYLYNPFGESVMRRIIEAVIGSVTKLPRPVYVIYLNPVCGSLWEGQSGVETIWSGQFGKAFRVGRH